MPAKPENNGLLFETGDRWKLDSLIPNRDRLLVGPQIPRTSLPRAACRVKITTIRGLDKRLSRYSPIYSRAESMLDIQHKLRRMYSGDIPLPGDRLL